MGSRRQHQHLRRQLHRGNLEHRRGRGGGSQIVVGGHRRGPDLGAHPKQPAADGRCSSQTGIRAIPRAAPHAGCRSARSGDTAVTAGESSPLIDQVANGLAIFILILVPVGGIVLFWLVHILPEKVAEKRQHPQKDAIKTLCLLSLVFGGMLWPIAWLWAYTK